MNLVETQRVRANKNFWKVGLTREIINLEDNLDKIFQSAGLKSHRIVQENDQESNLTTKDKIVSSNQGEVSDYGASIDGQVSEIKKAVSNICDLISSSTEFDLPIPVHVLLRLASRIASVRWLDYRKKLTGTLAKKYAYSKSPELIGISLMLYRGVSCALGTNIIPYQPYINQNILDILDWTRTSEFSKQNEAGFYSIRSQIFQNISAAMEQLSLNLNLEPKQLKTLLEVELVGSIEPMTLNASGLPVILSVNIGADNLSVLKDKYVVEALCCLEKLFMVYADFLDTSLECLVKNYVIQTCIKIYRDFEKNVTGLASRRQLLCLLEVVSSQPYASSTTEMAWNIMELAEKLETDAEIKYLARRSLKTGLAHRPTIVSHHDVYRCYGRQMDSRKNVELSMGVAAVSLSPDTNDYKTTDVDENKTPKSDDTVITNRSNASNESDMTIEPEASKRPETTIVPETIVESEMSNVEDGGTIIDVNEAKDSSDAGVVFKDPFKITVRGDATSLDENVSVVESDPEVQSFLSCFVDKPADS